MSGGFVERELAVARGLASCRGDDARLDEADAEIAKLRAENDALRAELREATEAMDDPEVNNLRTLPESIRMLRAERDARRSLLDSIVVEWADAMLEERKNK